MTKGDHPQDPRGLIREAYRIEGITMADCRSIFFDWALGQDDATAEAVEALLGHYGPRAPEHPMTAVLREGLSATPTGRRTGGARARREG